MPERCQLGEINRGRDAQRDGNDERDERGNQRPVDEGQGAELFRDRIPGRADEEVETKLPDGEHRVAPELPADQDNEQDDGPRHRHGEPFKRFVAEARRRRQLDRELGFGSARQRNDKGISEYRFKGIWATRSCYSAGGPVVTRDF